MMILLSVLMEEVLGFASVEVGRVVEEAQLVW